MQLQEKLMSQTWENDKEPSFEPDFDLFGPNLGPQNFFHGLYLYNMLDIVPSYHCMQFQGKLQNQTWENGKKPSLGLILIHLAKIQVTKFFFQKSGSDSH